MSTSYVIYVVTSRDVNKRLTAHPGIPLFALHQHHARVSLFVLYPRQPVAEPTFQKSNGRTGFAGSIHRAGGGTIEASAASHLK